MRVMIIGAGIGGLTLAQALHHGGIEVSVHDRDPQVGVTGCISTMGPVKSCVATSARSTTMPCWPARSPVRRFAATPGLTTTCARWSPAPPTRAPTLS